MPGKERYKPSQDATDTTKAVERWLGLVASAPPDWGEMPLDTKLFDDEHDTQSGREAVMGYLSVLAAAIQQPEQRGIADLTPKVVLDSYHWFREKRGAHRDPQVVDFTLQ